METNETIQESNNFGSDQLNKLVIKLQSSQEARKRYEYLLWLGMEGMEIIPNLEELVKNTLRSKG